MELNNLIEKLRIELKDIKKHKADYCSIAVEDVEAIIEFLEQFLAVLNELEKKDKVVNEMAKFIAGLDIDELICKDIEYCIADDEYTNCEGCIKEYFTNKAEKVGE